MNQQYCESQLLTGATKHRTGLTDRTDCTGRKLPHRRLKRPLTLTLILTLRQRPIVRSCRHARNGRFRRWCGDLMPVR